jgi:GR25 family glycosyltransferase involved in LPS biosynthesis
MPNEYSLIWPSKDGSMYVPNGDRNPDIDIKMNIPIFVLHYTPLVDRKKHILKQLEDHGLEAEFITQFDREEITDFTFFDTSKINVGCISNILKNVEVYRKMIEHNIPYAIVFDDDVYLAKDFNKIMNETLKNLPSTFDMCYMGDICGFHIEDINSDTNVYLKSNQEGPVFTIENGYQYAMGSTRGPAYILTNACAHKIMSMFVPGYIIRRLGHDHWINDVAREKNLEIYWSEPTFVCGGSDIEKFGNSLLRVEWANDPKHIKD